MCHDIVESFGIKIIIHPPDNNTMRANKKSDYIMPVEKYLKRNHNIVDTTDMLVAFSLTKEEIIFHLINFILLFSKFSINIFRIFDKYNLAILDFSLSDVVIIFSKQSKFNIYIT